MLYQSCFNSLHVNYYANILCTFNLLDTSLDRACTWLSNLFNADACRLWICEHTSYPAFCNIININIYYGSLLLSHGTEICTLGVRGRIFHWINICCIKAVTYCNYLFICDMLSLHCHSFNVLILIWYYSFQNWLSQEVSCMYLLYTVI